MVVMAETSTEWLWNVTMSDKIKKDKPVFPQFKNQIYESWVNIGWVKEKQAESEQLTLF